jgi:BNR repeat-like domain
VSRLARTIAASPVLVLVVAGLAVGPHAGAAASSRAPVGPLSLVSVPSPFTADCNGAPQIGTLYRNAEVEPHVAVNPTKRRNLIAAWQQDRWSSGGANGQLTAYSKDGGRTWEHPAAPPFGRCQGGGAANGGNYERVTDPWVSFGPTGIAYQIAIAGNNRFFGRHAVLLSRSRDGGASWGRVKTLIADDGPLLANDKETLTADPTDKRFVYATWWRFNLLDATGPSMFTRSTDAGRTWEPARQIFDSGSGPLNQTIGNQIVVEPNGDLINAFMWITGDPPGEYRIVAIRSNDRGRTWGPAHTIAEPASLPLTTDPRDGALVRGGEIIPDIAVDPRKGKRRLYAVWQDTVFTGQTQIALSRSHDGGRTWSAPVRVSQNPDTQAFTPAVEVNRGGHVAVSYYDFTHDSVASASLKTNYWTTRSTNGGRTFTRRARVTPQSFDLRTAPNARGFFLGDYEGLAATAGRFKLLFAQTTGEPDNPTDLFSTTLRGKATRGRWIPPRASAQPRNRAGGSGTDRSARVLPLRRR